MNVFIYETESEKMRLEVYNKPWRSEGEKKL